MTENNKSPVNANVSPTVATTLPSEMSTTQLEKVLNERRVKENRLASLAKGREILAAKRQESRVTLVPLEKEHSTLPPSGASGLLSQARELKRKRQEAVDEEENLIQEVKIAAGGEVKKRKIHADGSSSSTFSAKLKSAALSTAFSLGGLAVTLFLPSLINCILPGPTTDTPPTNDPPKRDVFDRLPFTTKTPTQTKTETFKEDIIFRM